jgi:hypothetical protein
MASGSEIEAGDGRATLLVLEMKQASYFKIISIFDDLHCRVSCVWCVSVLGARDIS